MTEKNTIQTSETFWSFQGEGPQTGRPQVWFRTTLCNFECQGFGNPEKKDTTSIAMLKFDPREFKDLLDMPNIHAGCDTQYSWNKELFEHVWTTWTFTELAEHLVSLIPFGKWVHPVTNVPVGLTITGGEPGLKLREIVEVLHEPALADLQVVTVETNCTVPIRQEQLDRIAEWLNGNPKRKWIWSNSPKLSNSGEKWKMAIKPKVALAQASLDAQTDGWHQVEQYFKFVSDGSDQSFTEIEQAVGEYRAAGISEHTPIWIMPEGATLEQQESVDATIINKAMARGYNVSPRVHVYVFGNAVGT